MPVHKVKGGFKWGKHGHVYKSRAAAAAQGRAAFANGYRGDAADRAVRRAAAVRMLAAVHRAEARYVRDLQALMRGVHKEYMGYFSPHLADRARTDATEHGGALDMLGIHIQTQIRKRVPPLFDRMSHAVQKAETLAELFGITAKATGFAAEVDRAREANVKLVEDAARDYASDVRDVFESPGSFGMRVEDLKDKLLERGNVSESRAELIARDQTLKLNGALNKARQTNAGVDSYVWSTSRDARVREEHAELEGQTFSWSAPPEIGYHPSEDYQCRCVALPVIPGLDETSDDE